MPSPAVVAAAARHCLRSSCRLIRSLRVAASGMQPTAAMTAMLAIMLTITLTSIAPRSLAAQQTADVIRGRVTGPDSQPVPNAVVTAVSYFGGITKTTRTDKNGRFSITYPNGEGDYWLSYAAIGFQARRFEVKRVADEEVLLADAKLSNAQTLATVNVAASGPKQTPGRTDNGYTLDPAGTDRQLGGAPVSPDQAGNLAAMAASSPGVQLIPGVDGNPDRFSIFGLDGAQNNAALNGQQGGLSNIPRDASVSTQLRAGYDVANGGFSGAQVNVTTQSGNNFITRSGSGFFNAPQAQWNDRVGQATQFSNISFGGRVSGPIIMDRDFYNVSMQFDRRAQDLPTLLSSTPVVFQSAGVASDSASRLRTVLGRLGVPTGTSAIGSTSPRTTASLLGSIDWAAKSPTSGQAVNIAFNGSFNTAGPQSTSLATQTPASLAGSTSLNGGMQLRHTNYFGSGILTESMFSVSAQTYKSDPYVDLPSGTVLVTSALDDGSSTTRSLGFGGGSNAGSNRTASVAARNMLSWFSDNSKHRVKLITELRTDQNSVDQAFNLLGRYTYQSLADLEAQRPSSFSRSLNAVRQSGSALVGAVAIGDAWRPNADLQVQYGVRVDGNRFLTTPASNDALRTALGVTNTRVPNGVYISPRAGFSLLYGKAPQIAYSGGFYPGPRATIRGGIGVFQNMRGPDLATGAISNTGLPSSAQQLVCTGDATPIVDWNALQSNPRLVPSQCANGTTGTLFANPQPSVTLFSSRYAQEQSIRSNLSWNGAILDHRFMLTVNGTYSYNMHQPDAVDINFSGQRRFSLNDENGRPVFVSPTSIDTRSGLIASRDARVSPLFNSVSELRSDLRSQSRQLSIQLSPYYTTPVNFRWSTGYTYLNVADQFRGFTSTVDDPFAIRSGTGATPQHDLQYTLSYTLFRAVTLMWNGRLTSGIRYTPTIAGDVNGDGRSNDRAFIFDPAKAADASVASDMRSLLDNGSSSARNCLRRQVGQFADRNSCTGPWTAGNTMLTISLNPSRIRMPDRTNLSFTLSNPIGAADLLLHGENKLRGWGQTPFLDPSLLFVRGFDASAQRYKYEVNQRFGSTRASQTITRTPVVLTMQLRVDLAPTRDWQSLEQTLGRGRNRGGAKMTEPQLRQMSLNMFPNPMGFLLQTSEELHLTRLQADSIATMSRRFTKMVDSVWTPSAKYFATIPKDFDRTVAQQRLVEARELLVGYLLVAAPNVRKMLTKGQQRVLPPYIANMLEPRYLELLRKGQVGSEFGFYF